MTVLVNKKNVKKFLISISSVLPEEHGPLCPRHNHRLIIQYQRLFEDIKQHDSEGHDDENVGGAGERHEELQRANLAHEEDGYHDDHDVESHGHAPSEQGIEDIVEGIGNEDDVYAAG